MPQLTNNQNALYRVWRNEMNIRKDTETYRLETEIGINKIFEC